MERALDLTNSVDCIGLSAGRSYFIETRQNTNTGPAEPLFIPPLILAGIGDKLGTPQGKPPAQDPGGGGSQEADEGAHAALLGQCREDGTSSQGGGRRGN